MVYVPNQNPVKYQRWSFFWNSEKQSIFADLPYFILKNKIKSEIFNDKKSS